MTCAAIPGIDVSSFESIEPLYRELLERPVRSTDEFDRWLIDISELSSKIDEYASRRYIEKSCNTEDPEIERRYLHFVEEIDPKIKPLFFAVQQKFLQSPHRRDDDPRMTMLERQWRADVEIFREDNIPLETESVRLVTEYDKICGAMTVFLQGAERTLPQAAKYLEETERQTRQWAWEIISTRRYGESTRLEKLFDELLELRGRVARHAGFDSYRSYLWRAYKRFDYTPEDCSAFSQSIEECCMPIVRRLDAARREQLGVRELRPWDLDVDPRNLPPLRPFDESDVEGFVGRTEAIFEELSPSLADQFRVLRRNGMLDLSSRKAKQPGGYQCSLHESKLPFIFMNAAGMHRDVETLLHEAGHAFHFLESVHEPLMFLRAAPMEFCEVASMAMELLAIDRFRHFYGEADARRAKREMLEGILRFFPWMATIDSFQHWIYTHPGHTPAERGAAWNDILTRFTGEMSWDGYEPIRSSLWLRQLHLFHAPFYYVEYGIAQIGALQLWVRSKHSRDAAIADYRAALSLGGSKPLPELFEAAGLRFDFSADTIRPLIEAVYAEWESVS